TDRAGRPGAQFILQVPLYTPAMNMNYTRVFTVVLALVVPPCARAESEWTRSGCPGGLCPWGAQGSAPRPPGNPFPAGQAPEPTRGSIVRVTSDVNYARSLGSGVLVAKTAEHGLVLTCGHLFRDGFGTVTVTFPAAGSFGAKVLGVDAEADLAA